MDIEDSKEQQIAAIAAEWGVSPDLLDNNDWELEEVVTSDGTVVAFLARFYDDTDRELLDALGVAPGEFTRDVTVNAFDVPDYDEES